MQAFIFITNHQNRSSSHGSGSNNCEVENPSGVADGYVPARERTKNRGANQLLVNSYALAESLPQLGEQRMEGEGFLNQNRIRIKEAVLSYQIIRIARHVQYF